MKDLYVNWIWPLLNWLLVAIIAIMIYYWGFFSWRALAGVTIAGGHLCFGETLELGEDLTKEDVLWHLLFFALLCLVIIGGILA